MGFFSNNDDDEKGDKPSGYKMEIIHFFDEEETSVSRMKLFLPWNNQLKSLINESKARSESKRAEFFEEEKKKIIEANQTSVEPTNETQLRDARKTLNNDPYLSAREAERKKNQKMDSLVFQDEELEIKTKYIEELETAKKSSSVEVYQWDTPLKIIDNFSTKIHDPDLKRRNFDLYTALKGKGNFRTLAMPREDEAFSLNKLYDSHPNFSQVIDFIREQITLCKVQEKAPHFPPILIFGPPGIGKTDFTHALSAILCTPVHRIGFDTGITDSTLTGSAAHWANSTPGILFETLVLGNIINPIFLLDEIDKADMERRNPLNPLHTILEPVTNTKVTDICVGIEFDTSHVLWIATANNPGRIPAPLRSRFKEFEVNHPAGADALKLAQTMARKTHAEMGLPELEPVHPQLIKLLAHLTAREQSQALKQAFAKAISNNRCAVTKEDLPADVFLDQDEPPSSNYLH